MKKQIENKRDGAEKLMHAIGELPDDMISKANPENWRNGVYIGEDAESTEDKDTQKSILTIISGWILTKRKMVAFAATMFLCVIVAGVWKMNSVGEHIEDKVSNEQSHEVIQDTSEPESTYNAVHDYKKTKKKKKDEIKKQEKKNKKEDNNDSVKDNHRKNTGEVEPDETPVPELGQYSDDNDDDDSINRRKGAAGETDSDNSEDTSESQAKDDEVAAEPPTALAPDDNTSATDTPVEDITVYKLDEQGNKNSINITSTDVVKLTDMIDGKKYITDAATEDCTVVIRYNGSDYYYDSSEKMLIISGKGAQLSDSENSELKKILKLD